MVLDTFKSISFISPLSATVAVIAVLLALTYYLLKGRDLLPGPTGVPYLGLWPLLEHDTCHLQLEEMAKKYGDLFSFTFLGNHIINLGSAKAIREAHVNKSDCFAGRFTDFNILTYLLENGVAMVNGEPWKVLRKFFVTSFKEHGMTTLSDKIAAPISDSLEGMIEDFRKTNSKPFNVIELLTVKCMSTMKRLLFGEEGVTDEDLLEMNRLYATALEGMLGTKLLYIGPFGRLIFRISPTYRAYLSEHKIMCGLLRKAVKKIESSMDENHPTCVIESFYKERNERRRRNDPTAQYFSDKSLINSVSQFVGDGILSVAYFIGIFLHSLIVHPEEQDKLYEEIVNVLGPYRHPTSDDWNKLPYTKAFMYETIRSSNFFTLFPSMECSKETTLRGHRIPKGSITLLNIWASHHDPVTYENPHKFDPSRFLATPRPELPVMFGMGKRSCTGEPFVMMKSFLFLTTIVQNFRLTEPDKSNTKSELFLMTGNMEICVHPRNEK